MGGCLCGLAEADLSGLYKFWENEEQVIRSVDRNQSEEGNIALFNDQSSQFTSKP